MIEEIFPADVGRQAQRSIQRNVLTVKNKYGFQQNSSNDPDGGLRLFTFQRRLLNDTDFNEVRDFYIGTNHGTEGMLFQDWKDNSIVDGYIATGDGVEDSFNLIKRYEISTVTDIDRRIFYPDAIDAVYFDDVEQVSGWSWNSTTKQIDFTSPPGNTVIITVDVDLFYVPVVFSAELSNTNDILSVSDYGSIVLQEIIIDV